MFDVSLMIELMDMKLYAGLATEAWWKNKVDLQANSLNAVEYDVPALQKTWNGLKSKLTVYAAEYCGLVDYPPNLFRCCIPTKISCDGLDYANIRMCHKRRRMANN